MTLLIPLGLLGLLAIAALILIYIIKPNYQQKFISSTYVWKLSLKLKRKKLPLNRLRNILKFYMFNVSKNWAQVSLYTYIRNQIHHQADNGKPSLIDLESSIMIMRNYLKVNL